MQTLKEIILNFRVKWPILSIIALTSFSNPISGQTVFPNDPDSAKIHTEDIALFWKVFNATTPGFDGKTFKKEYLDAGSEGLKGFIKMRIESGENLSKTIKENVAYYNAIRNSSLSIENKRDTLQKHLKNFKIKYPAAVFPDVYFVIGAKNSGGTVFNGGLIVGAEMFGKESDNFKPRLNIEVIDLVVIHELVHFQQKYITDNTLLAQSIKEGAADFICELVTGSHSNKPIYEYGNSHEKELWLEFKEKMHSKDWKPWLYGSKDNSRPQDLGYWMGYRIVKAYYYNMEDKSKAIDDILNINNFKEFLQKSGYNPQ